MHLSGDFPGGNIVLESMDGDTARLRPDPRDTEGDWFYWHFRVSRAAGRTIRFEFTRGPAVGVRGPAVSEDGGVSWRWLGADTHDAFTYTFAAADAPVAFCMTIPYIASDWHRFLAAHRDQSALRAGRLCVSAKGRPVETLAFGHLRGEPRHRALLVARHHCCETMASFALEGMISFVLGDEPEARRLREQVEFLAVPFMDKDGVEDGDQGKNRRPRDHNRDYAGTSIHRETAALRALVPDWAGGRLSVALDLHCPWLFGRLSERIYLVGLPAEERWREQQRFAARLESVRTGPLPFHAADNLPYGREWNTDANYAKGLSFAGWVAATTTAPLVATLELPYANARGVEVAADSARAFGADLARALAAYLE